ncbi:DUF3923 family protein [Lysinibacillus sp. NPDC096418]|uniref:DUF3923 family protein n=1 Tax=Lysinibacillus sp. NPDC096418 TaxID=3364138 RepID=UPI003803A6D7
MKLWWFANVFWLVMFALGAIFIGLREVDGAGISQTPEIKAITFIMVGILFVIIMFIQIVWLFFVKKLRY